MNQRIPTDDLSQLAPRRLLIGGKLIDGDRQSMPVVNPTDGSSLGSVPVADASLVDEAVLAATAAFPGWRNADLRKRQSALFELAGYLMEDIEALAFLDAIDSGLPIEAARSNVRFADTYIRYIAGLAYSWGGRTVPMSGAFDFTVRTPFGPTARIIPFNHPVMFAAWKIAGPLLVGNTIVLKLPDQAPLSGLRLSLALQRIFPPGVVNVVTGPGQVTGDHLVRHSGIKRVAFIGSVSTGRRILAAAAERNVPVTAELGGKNAHIITGDADLERAASCAVAGMSYQGAGQSCGSYSRVLVHDSVYERTVKLISELTRRVRVGDPLKADTDMGPLIGQDSVARARAAVEEAVGAGATLALGEANPDGDWQGSGYFMPPTILTNVSSDMRVAQEELFAPVQSILRWSTLDEVIALANDTEFGLCASVHTRNIDTAMALTDALEVGSVSINGTGSQHWLGAPFGGVKASGIGGKEDSVDELYEATYEKNVHVAWS